MIAAVVVGTMNAHCSSTAEDLVGSVGLGASRRRVAPIVNLIVGVGGGVVIVGRSDVGIPAFRVVALDVGPARAAVGMVATVADFGGICALGNGHDTEVAALGLESSAVGGVVAVAGWFD